MEGASDLRMGSQPCLNALWMTVLREKPPRKRASIQALDDTSGFGSEYVPGSPELDTEFSQELVANETTDHGT